MLLPVAAGLGGVFIDIDRDSRDKQKLHQRDVDGQYVSDSSLKSTELLHLLIISISSFIFPTQLKFHSIEPIKPSKPSN